MVMQASPMGVPAIPMLHKLLQLEEPVFPRCNYLFHLLVTLPCWVVACPSL